MKKKERRSSKVFEPDMSTIDEALLAELTVTTKWWRPNQLFGKPLPPSPQHHLSALASGAASLSSSSSSSFSSGPPPPKYIVAHMNGFRKFIPDDRWWDAMGLNAPDAGRTDRLMVLRWGMRVDYTLEKVRAEDRLFDYLTHVPFLITL